MSEFAIKVDLTDFFTDERKRAVVLIDGNWKSVEELEKRIEFLFKLKDVHFLTDDGCFVPPQEPIRVVSSANTLKAFVLSKSKTEDKSCVEGVRKEKRKFDSLETEFVSSTPSQTVKRCKKLTKQKTPKEATPISDQGSFSHSTLVNEQPDINQVENISAASPQPASASYQGKENTIRQKHIHFSDQQEQDSVNLINEAANKSFKNVVFRCTLIDLPTNKTRTFDLRSKSSKLEILEDLRIPSLAAGVPMLVQSITDRALVEKSSVENGEKTEISMEESYKEQGYNESSVILLDDSEVDESKRNINGTILKGLEINETKETSAREDDSEVDKMLKNSKCLESLPAAGDVVLFKLSLPNSKTARTTEYIVGLCDYVNRRSKQITYSLISFPPEIVSLLRKWSANMDDSVDTVNKIILKFSEMIEPRLHNT